MSKESSAWLNNNVLVGFTAERGNAWHYRATDQGEESNHYKGAIPVADVGRRLFHWEAISCPMGYDVTAALGSAVQVWKPSSTGRQVIVRSDTLAEMGVFKKGYEIHQYGEWLVEKVHEVNGQLEVGSAGLLKGGAQAWVSFEVPETLSHTTGMAFRPQLIACTSFNGSLATTYKRATTIVVCDNTLTAGLGERGQTVKVKHSKNSLRNLKSSMVDVLGLYETQVKTVTEQITQLSQWEVSDREWFAFLDKWVPIPEANGRSRTLATTKQERLRAMWNNDNRVSPWKNTALGVWAAANTWLHHESIVRSAGHRAERNMTNALDDTTRKEDEAVIKLLATITG